MVLLWLAVIPQSREELATLEQGSDGAQVCCGHPIVRRRRRGDRVRIGGQEVILHRRRLVRTVGIREDNQDVADPEAFIEALKRSPLKPDLFTFRQRLTDPRPKYP